MLNWTKGRLAVRELKRDAVFGHGTPCMRTTQLILLPSDGLGCKVRHTGSRQIPVEDHVRPGVMNKKAVPFRFTDPAASALTRCPVATLIGRQDFSS